MNLTEKLDQMMGSVSALEHEMVNARLRLAQHYATHRHFKEMRRSFFTGLEIWAYYRDPRWN